MTLALDTTVFHVVRVRVDDRNGIRRATLRGYADTALVAISKKIGKKIPERIGVVNGPGAMSATRNGVALANALAYAWQIPVVALTVDQFNATVSIPKGTRAQVRPIYGMEPNITKKKK